MLFAISLLFAAAEPTESIADAEIARAASVAANQPLLIVLTSRACAACDWISTRYAQDESVANELNKFVVVTADVEAAATKNWLGASVSKVLPAFEVRSPDGTRVLYREFGEREPAEFGAWLREVQSLALSQPEFGVALSSLRALQRDGETQACLRDAQRLLTDRRTVLGSDGRAPSRAVRIVQTALSCAQGAVQPTLGAKQAFTALLPTALDELFSRGAAKSYRNDNLQRLLSLPLAWWDEQSRINVGNRWLATLRTESGGAVPLAGYEFAVWTPAYIAAKELEAARVHVQRSATRFVDDHELDFQRALIECSIGDAQRAQEAVLAWAKKDRAPALQSVHNARKLFLSAELGDVSPDLVKFTLESWAKAVDERSPDNFRTYFKRDIDAARQRLTAKSTQVAPSTSAPPVLETEISPAPGMQPQPSAK